MRRQSVWSRLDVNDPNYEPPYEVDEEYEAECKLEDMENNERWGIE